MEAASSRPAVPCHSMFVDPGFQKRVLTFLPPGDVQSVELNLLSSGAFLVLLRTDQHSLWDSGARS